MRLLHSEKTKYPVLGKEQKLRSAVIVDLVVNEDGTVRTATLSRSCGIKEYDDAVVSALKKWHYDKASGCGDRQASVTLQIRPK